MDVRSRTRAATVREEAQARGPGAPTGVGGSGQGAQRAATAMRERGFQNLKSGARALRKYACDANEIWETMHASDEMGVRRQLRELYGARWSKRPLQRSTLREGYVEYPPWPDRMHPIGSYVIRGAGCHGCEDHPWFIWGSAPY
eukprot:6199844-Pleurochrysis_carterae.AAC.7